MTTFTIYINSLTAMPFDAGNCEKSALPKAALIENKICRLATFSRYSSLRINKGKCGADTLCDNNSRAYRQITKNPRSSELAALVSENTERTVTITPPIESRCKTSSMTLDDFLASVEVRAFKTACFSTRSKADACDIVQDAMIKLVKSYRKREANEWPLLFNRILQNTIIDWHRANQRNRKVVSFDENGYQPSSQSERPGNGSLGNSYDSPYDNSYNKSHDNLYGSEQPEANGYASADSENPLKQLARIDDINALQEAIEQLPLRQRQAFLLRNWEGFDVAETATIMDCSNSSVKTHHARAIKALRKLLKHDPATDSTTNNSTDQII